MKFLNAFLRLDVGSMISNLTATKPHDIRHSMTVIRIGSTSEIAKNFEKKIIIIIIIIIIITKKSPGTGSHISSLIYLNNQDNFSGFVHACSHLTCHPRSRESLDIFQQSAGNIEPVKVILDPLPTRNSHAFLTRGFKKQRTNLVPPS